MTKNTINIDVTTRRENRDTLIELCIWVFLAAFISGRLTMFILESGFNAKMLFEYYPDIVFSMLVLIFPFLYRLIFGCVKRFV